MGPEVVIPLTLLLGLAFGHQVFRVVRPACRSKPWLRPLLIVASLAALVLVGAAAPRIGDLDPPFSESPAGIFVILGRVAVFGAVAVAALAAILAAVLPPAEE